MTQLSATTDFDNLSIDDIEDLPEFGAWPAGTYTALLTLERKTVNEHPSVEAKFTLQAVEALNDPSQDEPRVGSESSILFMLDNEFGAGNFKKLGRSVVAYTGCQGTVNEIVANVKAAPVVVTLTAKDDKNKILRNNIAELVFA